MQHPEKHKWALITGATSGFGYEFAKLFAQDGYNLILVARSGGSLLSLSEELTQAFMIQVLCIDKDLFQPQAAEEIYAEVKSKNIAVEVLVNDAGQGQHGYFIETPIARDIDLIQLNITSLVSLTKLFLKDMVERNDGKILNVASILAKYPTPMMAVYAATKAFVLSFSEALIKELEETGVTVTTLLPGASDTDFFHKAKAEHTSTYREENLSNPVEVARDGYDALMKGKHSVVSGMKNKLYNAASNILPDGALSTSMKKQMSPGEKQDGRESITHAPSLEERKRIERATGSPDGDYQEHEDHIHNQE